MSTISFATPPPWHQRAVCLVEDDLEAFFPNEGNPAAVQEAIAVCDTCPVRQICLDDALSRETPDTAYGIYGALTATERKRILRRRKGPRPRTDP